MALHFPTSKSTFFSVRCLSSKSAVWETVGLRTHCNLWGHLLANWFWARETTMQKAVIPPPLSYKTGTRYLRSAYNQAKMIFFFFFFARILPTDISHLLIPKAWAYFVNLTHKVLLLQYFRQEHFMCCLPIHLQYHCAQTCKRLFHPKEPNRMIHSLGPCISRRLEKAVTLLICHRSFLAVRRLNFFYTIRRMQQAKRLHGVWGKSQHHSPHSTLVQKQ